MALATASPESESNFLAAQVAFKGKIHTYAKNAVGSLPGYDTDDIEQELLSVLWRCVESYDPSKGANFNTFAQRSFQHRVASLVREVTARKRKPPAGIVSLDEEAIRIAVDERISESSAEDVAIFLDDLMDRLRRLECGTSEGTRSAARNRSRGAS